MLYKIERRQRHSDTCFPSFNSGLWSKITLFHNSHVPKMSNIPTLYCVPDHQKLIQTSYTHALQDRTSTTALRHLLPIIQLGFMVFRGCKKCKKRIFKVMVCELGMSEVSARGLQWRAWLVCRDERTGSGVLTNAWHLFGPYSRKKMYFWKMAPFLGSKIDIWPP